MFKIVVKYPEYGNLKFSNFECRMIQCAYSQLGGKGAVLGIRFQEHYMVDVTLEGRHPEIAQKQISLIANACRIFAEVKDEIEEREGPMQSLLDSLEGSIDGDLHQLLELIVEKLHEKG